MGSALAIKAIAAHASEKIWLRLFIYVNLPDAPLRLAPQFLDH
jgi:hypothetical protein